MRRLLPILWSFPILLIAAALYAATPLDVSATGQAITGANRSVTFTLGTRQLMPTATTRVFTMQGVQVAELSAQSLSRFSWDGKDVDEQDVANGFYVVQIEQNGAFWHGPVVVKR